VSQIALIALAVLPPRFWASFKGSAAHVALPTRQTTASFSG
jgi:hypothetical protein